MIYQGAINNGAKYMKIKENLSAMDVYTSQPWEDLFETGTLTPHEICKYKKDADKVVDAIATLKDFIDSCEEQIDGFLQ